MMRYGANYIFPVNKPPIRNGIIETDDNGVIKRIIEPNSNFQEIHSTQFFNGIIVPGFVNTHCHLELSHLKGLKPKKSGIASFIQAVTSQREISEEIISKSISNAIDQAKLSGTVAIADICNTTSTLPHKLKSDIYFHNFIELFGINPTSAENTFDNGLKIYSEFKKQFPESTNLTPHSTYSLSEPLWDKISNHLSGTHGGTASIHYGESMAEYEFLATGGGPLFHRYTNANIQFIPPKGQSPYSVVTQNIPKHTNIILVHTTFAEVEELKTLNSLYSNMTIVTCPESNLIIEKTLPKLDKFVSNGLNIAIGTDSLASASSLSMLNQIMIILNHFSTIDFQTALKWATINGAKALYMDKTLGTFEVGKKPGLVLIDQFDFTNMRPTEKSMAKRLI